MAVLSSTQRDVSPKCLFYTVLPALSCLPHIPQLQLKVKERPKLCVLDLQKYSPSFWSLALLLKGWRRDRKGVGKGMWELLHKPGEWTRAMQPRKEIL